MTLAISAQDVGTQQQQSVCRKGRGLSSIGNLKKKEKKKGGGGKEIVYTDPLQECTGQLNREGLQVDPYLLPCTSTVFI